MDFSLRNSNPKFISCPAFVLHLNEFYTLIKDVHCILIYLVIKLMIALQGVFDIISLQ